MKMTASRPGYNLLPWRQVITSHMPMTSMEPQWVPPASWGSLFTFSKSHASQAHSWHFCLQGKTTHTTAPVNLLLGHSTGQLICLLSATAAPNQQRQEHSPPLRFCKHKEVTIPLCLWKTKQPVRKKSEDA